MFSLLFAHSKSFDTINVFKKQKKKREKKKHANRGEKNISEEK